MVKKMGLESQSWLQALALPLIICITLENKINHSRLQFSQLKDGPCKFVMTMKYDQ
jgi:hypothetical protein